MLQAVPKLTASTENQIIVAFSVLTVNFGTQPKHDGSKDSLIIDLFALLALFTLDISAFSFFKAKYISISF